MAVDNTSIHLESVNGEILKRFNWFLDYKNKLFYFKKKAKKRPSLKDGLLIVYKFRLVKNVSKSKLQSISRCKTYVISKNLSLRCRTIKLQSESRLSCTSWSS